MKIDGITLLQKIKNGEIKEKTKIREYYLEVPTKHILEVTNNNLVWKPGEFTVGELWHKDYSFEIIEERPKEIELLNENGFHNNQKVLARKINELINEVNLLKKEEDKK